MSAARHLLESPHALTFTPEGHAAISAMQADAHERIRARSLELAAAGCGPRASDAYRLALAQFEAETWANLAAVFSSLMGLGGRVTVEDARNLYVIAPHLVYGVNQSRHDGSWSVNS